MCKSEEAVSAPHTTNRFATKSDAMDSYMRVLNGNIEQQNNLIDKLTDIDSMPDDTFESGSVIVFDRITPAYATHTAPTMSTTVAIKGLDGYWYTTHMGPVSWWQIITEAYRNEVYSVEEVFLVENDE